MTRIGLLAVASLVLGACGDDAPSGRPGPTSPPSHVGRWRTEPFLSQLGLSVQELRLGSDGRFELVHTLTQAGVPPLRMSGTYRIEGDRLELHGEMPQGGRTEKGDQLFTWKWDGPALVLTEKNGDSYRFLRRPL